MFQLQTHHLILSPQVPQQSWHASGLRLGPVPVPRPIGFGNWISGDVAVSHIYICTAWWFQPLWKILVSWDHMGWLFPILYMEKKMFQTTNQIWFYRDNMRNKWDNPRILIDYNRLIAWPSHAKYLVHEEHWLCAALPEPGARSWAGTFFGPPGPTAHPSSSIPWEKSWSKFLPRKAIGVMVCLPGHIVHIHHVLGINTCQHMSTLNPGTTAIGRLLTELLVPKSSSQNQHLPASPLKAVKAIFGHGLPPLQPVMRGIWGDWSVSYYPLVI